MLLPVVLAGGTGSRLWPLSRALLPKQFINFGAREGSLFQDTLRRLQGLENLGEPIVVCNAEHRFLVAEQLRHSGTAEPERATIMLEPVGRNTAPALALAALSASRDDAAALLLVLPADHAIEDQAALHAAIDQARELALEGRLVTFGIVPGAPETGYGYIQKGDALEQRTGFEVKRFVEKPDLEQAREYLDSGDYLWNSGMFLFPAADYLAELQKHRPDIMECCRQAFAEIEAGPDFQRIPQARFAACPGDSIDYAVMEKTSRGAVVPLDAGWSDLGAWDALWDLAEKDDGGNAVSGDVLLENVTGSYLHAGHRLLAAVGLRDTIVVETADTVLVADRSRAQAVKLIVERLQADQREEGIQHLLVQRPWGSYESLASGPGYQVKHIVVRPGEALSLQRHRRRAEHWTVIRGEGRITCGEEEFTLGVNESAFIPLGAKHRLANPGRDPVEIIEVQVGDYLGEDDIERFEDKYGRVEK